MQAARPMRRAIAEASARPKVAIGRTTNPLAIPPEGRTINPEKSILRRLDRPWEAPSTRIVSRPATTLFRLCFRAIRSVSPHRRAACSRASAPLFPPVWIPTTRSSNPSSGSQLVGPWRWCSTTAPHPSSPRRPGDRGTWPSDVRFRPLRNHFEPVSVKRSHRPGDRGLPAPNGPLLPLRQRAFPFGAAAWAGIVAAMNGTTLHQAHCGRANDRLCLAEILLRHV